MYNNSIAWQCPIPSGPSDVITLAHGGGGQLNRKLIEEVFLPVLSNETLAKMEDSACLNLSSKNIAFTTDGFVVDPLFFPGGNIGDLAVHGTINDLAVSGALPQYISAGFIIEEGLPLVQLQRIVESMALACQSAGVQLVAGDTKVVEHGKGDKLFITTAGIGTFNSDTSLSVSNAQPGDHIIVSGTIGDHGSAIMAAREDLNFDCDIVSDTASLHSLTALIAASTNELRCMRDPTRGGLAATLTEIADASEVEIVIEANAIPVTPAVGNFCEVLGLKPLHLANEGKLVAIVSAQDSERVLVAMRGHPLGGNATLIGYVTEGKKGVVNVESVTGIKHRLMLPEGDPLPRIC